MTVTPTYEELLERVRRLEKSGAAPAESRRREERTTRLLEAIGRAQALYIDDGDPAEIHRLLLQTLVDASRSEYGFLDEVLFDESGRMYKRNLAISDITWDEASRALYGRLRDREMKFGFLANLSGLPALTGKAVISNDPAGDGRAGGLPKGHPSIASFMGLPLRFGGRLVGVAGVANRKGGYHGGIARFLEPLLHTCASITHALQKAALEKDLASRERTAERKIRRSEENFRQMTDAMQETLSVLTLDGDFLYANTRAARNMSGSRGVDVVGRNLRDFLPAQQAENLIGLYRTVYRTGRPVLHELAVGLKKGETWFLNTLKPLDYGAGRTPAVLSVSLDISDRKRSEIALRESEERYRTLVVQSADCLILHDSEGRILDVNPCSCRTYGYSRAALLGMKVGDLDPDDGQRGENGALPEGLAPGAATVFEARQRSADGRVFPVEVRLSPVNYRGKTLIQGLYRDISERQRARQALVEEKQKFQSMVENIGTGVALINRRMEIIELNRQMREWFPEVDPAARPVCHRAFNDPPGETVCDWCPTRKTLRDGKVHESITRTPRAGGVRNYRVVSSPVLDSGGKVKAAIEMVDDITEQLKFEEQIRRAQRMEAIANLAGGIAHDFNNLLFPIIGISEMLMEDLPPGSPERESVEEIFRAGRRGSDLVRQILAFSRQYEHKMTPTRVQQVLKEVLKLSRSAIPADIRIQQEIQPDCGLILADPTQIHQVAMNIVTNAYHAMEEKGGVLTVRLAQAELKASESREVHLDPGGYVVLSISDTGHGIPEAHVDRIFDPYFTTKELGKGTGLGLAVVYGIVQEHGGGVRVCSEAGRGTTFHVYLPLMEGTDPVEAGEGLEPHRGGDEHILLVDDEPPVAKLERLMLERLGYRVTSCFHAGEALALFRADPQAFDLVITDMSMPSLTGAQLAEKILAARADLPVVICSGYSERIDAQKAAAIGIAGFLMKPIARAQLAKAVRNALDGNPDADAPPEPLSI